MKSFKLFFESQFYNDTLHDAFWDAANNFDQVVREKLLTIAKDVCEGAGVKDQLVDDIQLTGSMANFNYTDFSDLDVHVLLDFAKINHDEDLVKKALDGKRFVWNLRHDINMGGHDVELYFQDTEEPHKASGLYSILNNKWIREPEHNEPEVDERDVSAKADRLKGEIADLEVALQTTPIEELDDLAEAADALRSKVAKMRKDSLESNGEFGIGNLAFKELRNSDYMERLIDVANAIYDKKFTQ
jgi:predicted nucleotidyltransferase